MEFPEAVIQEHLAISDYTAPYRCANCELETFIPQIMGSPSFYAAASGSDEAGKHTGYYEETKWDFSEALKDLTGGGSLIEFGCGPGNFLKMAGERLTHAVGVEFNPMAARIARQQGFVVHESAKFPGSDEQSFDAAFSFHVLEHVSDPKGFLASLAAQVKPGGVIGISVPNQNGPIRFIDPCAMNMPPHHATRWTLKTFEAAAERLGWTIRRVAYEPLLLENHSYYSVYWPRTLLPGSNFLARVCRSLLSLSLRAFFGLLFRLSLRYFPLLRGQSIYVLLVPGDRK